MPGDEELGIIICSHIFKNTKPVLLVVRRKSGIQMLCGGTHEGGEHDRPHLVGLGHLLSRDPSIDELYDLREGWEAERESPKSPWIRRESEPEE